VSLGRGPVELTRPGRPPADCALSWMNWNWTTAFLLVNRSTISLQSRDMVEHVGSSGAKLGVW
jgi:hypothetical protein